MARTPDKVMLDTNILMELFMERHFQAAVLRELSVRAAASEFVTSVLSVSIFFYFVEKNHYSKPNAHHFLANYQVADMAATDYTWAAANDLGDFEDALQVACALRHKCTRLLTLDENLSKNHAKHIATTLVR